MPRTPSCQVEAGEGRDGLFVAVLRCKLPETMPATSRCTGPGALPMSGISWNSWCTLPSESARLGPTTTFSPLSALSSQAQAPASGCCSAGAADTLAGFRVGWLRNGAWFQELCSSEEGIWDLDRCAKRPDPRALENLICAGTWCKVVLRRHGNILGLTT